jgi:hypothetical protein
VTTPQVAPRRTNPRLGQRPGPLELKIATMLAQTVEEEKYGS